MSSAAEQITVALNAEEQARANFYALLARLFYESPDADFLRGIASSDEVDAQTGSGSNTLGEAGPLEDDSIESPPLELTWRDLVDAATNADEIAIATEYNELFVGSGRSEISLYLGAYTTRSGIDTPLVALREFLLSHGIQRQSKVHEPEDHFAMLFEVMRYLISEKQATIEEQRSFFKRFVQSGAISLCDAISENERAQFYRHVAAFAKIFLMVEHDAFQM